MKNLLLSFLSMQHIVTLDVTIGSQLLREKMMISIREKIFDMHKEMTDGKKKMILKQRIKCCHYKYFIKEQDVKAVMIPYDLRMYLVWHNYCWWLYDRTGNIWNIFNKQLTYVDRPLSVMFDQSFCSNNVDYLNRLDERMRFIRFVKAKHKTIREYCIDVLRRNSHCLYWDAFCRKVFLANLHPDALFFIKMEFSLLVYGAVTPLKQMTANEVKEFIGSL